RRSIWGRTVSSIKPRSWMSSSRLSIASNPMHSFQNKLAARFATDAASVQEAVAAEVTRRIWPKRKVRPFRLVTSAATAVLGCLLTLPTVVAAEPGSTTREIAELTLDQLINIKVISVSKRETLLENSPAAIAILTQND